jgi:transcriptional regulator with XRE-family HTH domain
VADRDSIYREFGLKLCALRKSKKLSQSQLGELVSLSRVSINNMEHGRQKVQLHLLLLFAEIFQVDPAVFLSKPSPLQQVDLKKTAYVQRLKSFEITHSKKK